MGTASAHKALRTGDWLNWEQGQHSRALIFTEALATVSGDRVDVRVLAATSFTTAEACAKCIYGGAALSNLHIAKAGTAAMPGYILKELEAIRRACADITDIFVVWQKYGDPFMNYEFRAILRTEVSINGTDDACSVRA